ncbi:permease [Akkermansia glycaniphila]|uniref:Predicted permease n=1 Tax=Akkermansia glycaniphila TaxID=1679444 RepID=A0A1C7PD95_9BACT|nr:permease [Akkermansia glycaniphila]OCA03527.1 permease [Akkermansia glycaniphila]SEH84098.1 predicted permease [Akkermansia glycaniphila]
MIQDFADWLVFSVLEFSPGTRLGEAVNFFVYDTVKILFLLYAISLVMGVVNAYFPVDRIRVFLTTRKLYGLQYFFAALFGAVTPFCSCSSIPLFIGFVKGGIPLGVTFAFLITSPLVNEVAIAMFLGVFGWEVTAIYAVSGVVLGMVGGAVLQRFRLERFLSPWVKDLLSQSERESAAWEKKHVPFKDRLPEIASDAWGIVKGVVLYVVIGIAVGAGIHGYVPEGFFEQYLGAESWWGVPAAVLCGVPMYANAAGIVPVIQVFVAKGIPIGTALAFMMATVGLSLPEAILLKKVMTWKLIGIFFATVSLLIVFSGYLFNFLM